MVEAARAALDSLPEPITKKLGDVAVIVEDSHPDGIMGIYDPVGGLRRIVVFRDANPTPEEVRKTVLHEVGHHFGMGEGDLDRLGYR
ncbi:MAG TPA: metallopeptidase family protein [Solirubrobacterales bacterium]|nr:metallopeptidase family protein [Solirubrobacterales bacterium]